MKEGFKLTGIYIAIIIVVLLAGLGFGYYKVFYLKTVGTATESAKRDIFKHNKSYTEGMVSDLVNLRLQYEKEKEKDGPFKTALRETIISKFANFDINLIEDENLKQFLLNIRNGGH